MLHAIVIAAAVAAPLSEAVPPPCGPLTPGPYILTMSPGDSLNNLFGHTALVLPDAKGRPVVFDWGNYSLGDWRTVWGVLRGSPSFRLDAEPLPSVLERFRRRRRFVVAQRLELSERTLVRLQGEVLRQKPLEEPSFEYHWLRRNCTTEVLAVLDAATDGAISAQHAAPAPTGPAEHALRHAHDKPAAWLGLHLGCGLVAHRPGSYWDAMFVPDYAAERLDVSLGEDGQPLVSETCTLVAGELGFAPAVPPNRDRGMALAGVLGAAALLGARRVGPRLAQVGVALVGLQLGLWGTVALLIGALGMFEPVWELHNQPFASPGSFALVFAAWWARRGDPDGARVAAVMVAIAALGVLGALLRGLSDHNLGVMALAVPWVTASWWVLRQRA